MRLTTKGRFAVTAMIDLALREHSGPVALAAISARQQISLSYLEQLFGKLRRHELVESTRGPGRRLFARPQGRGDLGRRHHRRGRRADRRHRLQRPGELHGRPPGRCMTHDLWAEPQRPHDRVPRFDLAEEAGRRADRQGRVDRGAAGQARDLQRSRSSSRSRSPRRTRCSPSATRSRSERAATRAAQRLHDQSATPPVMDMTPHFPIYLDYAATTP